MINPAISTVKNALTISMNAANSSTRDAVVEYSGGKRMRWRRLMAFPACQAVLSFLPVPRPGPGFPLASGRRRRRKGGARADAFAEKIQRDERREQYDRRRARGLQHPAD